MFRFVCLALCIAVASAGKIDIQECTEYPPIGTNIMLEVEGVADGTTTMTLEKGQEYSMCISFTAASASATLENSLFGEIAGIQVPWNGVEKDACVGLTEGSCPLVAGQSYKYCTALKVEDSYPNVSLVIIWNQLDSNDERQVCFRLPAKITG